MKVPFVDLKAQYANIKDEIDQAIAEVISKTAFIGGPFAKSFEEKFAEFCNVKYCVGVGNGTDALFIALKALGIGEGDEVITAANSFIATSEAITMTGAKVVFVDIDPKTYNMDPKKLDDYLKSRLPASQASQPPGFPASQPPSLYAKGYNPRSSLRPAGGYGSNFRPCKKI